MHTLANYIGAGGRDNDFGCRNQSLKEIPIKLCLVGRFVGIVMSLSAGLVSFAIC